MCNAFSEKAWYLQKIWSINREKGRGHMRVALIFNGGLEDAVDEAAKAEDEVGAGLV